jgi:hypothetical protein
MPISIPASPSCERGRKRSVRTGTPRSLATLRVALKPHSRGQFAKRRSLSAYPLLVGLELPADEFVALVLDPPRACGIADHRSASFHPGCLGRAHEQPLSLRRSVRAQIGVAGLVAYEGDYTAAACCFRGGFLLAAVEAVVKTELCPGFGKLVSTPTITGLSFFKRQGVPIEMRFSPPGSACSFL